MRKVINILFLLLFFNIPSAFSKNTQSLTLATTPWCPYTCKNDIHKDGVIGTYIHQLLAKEGIDLSIQSYPWSRAILLANEKKVDGLLTATHEEAPNLLFTSVPITHYQVCFYTRAEDTWHYQEPLTIENQLFGVIQDYGYGEPVDTYIKTSNQVVTISGSNAAKRLLDMLLNQRVDIIVADTHVMRWTSRENKVPDHKIRPAGCLNSHPFYLALTAIPRHQKLIKILDRVLSLPANQSHLVELFNHN